MKNIILVTNSIYNLAGHVLLAIVGLISVKYIFSQLGGDMLGLIFFANLLGVVFANIFEKGIFSLTTREVAKFYNKDKKKLISFLGVWSVYVWILFLIIITIIFLIIPYLNDKFINIQYLDIQTTELILCLLSFSVFLNFPCSFYIITFKISL